MADYSPVDVSMIGAVDWSPKLGEIGQVVESIADVEQEINIVLVTPKKSDPHRPTFGSDVWQYVDHPINEAGPKMVAAAIEAINTWISRAKVERVTAEAASENVRLTVYWRLIGDDLIQSTEVDFVRL